jgi:hypothetical protein
MANTASTKRVPRIHGYRKDGRPIWSIMGGAEEGTPEGAPVAVKDKPNEPKPEAKPDAKPDVKPPWGSADEFDPEKAWQLITNLRAQKGDATKQKELETKLAELEPLAQKARELEESKKSDLQRITDRAEKAEKDRDAHASTATRLQVAMDKAPDGTPLSAIRAAAKRISGATQAELEADAEEFFTLIAPASKTPSAKEVIPGKPDDKREPAGGDATDPKAIARAALGRGRF